MAAGAEFLVAHLEPGDFGPETHFHEIGGEIVRNDFLPRTLVDAPLEIGARELEADAHCVFVGGYKGTSAANKAEEANATPAANKAAQRLTSRRISIRIE